MILENQRLWQRCSSAPGRAGNREPVLNANGPGWLHCKLMCDLGRRGLGARTRSHSQLETEAAPGEPNKMNIPMYFSLLYPGSCNCFAKGCSYCGERARSRKRNPAGPLSQAVPAPGLEPGQPFAALLTPKGCEQAGEHRGDVAHPLESTRELSNQSLEELPQAGREAFKAKANDSRWHSACPTGPSHIPSGGTYLQRSGLRWQGGAAPQSALLPSPP